MGSRSPYPAADPSQRAHASNTGAGQVYELRLPIETVHAPGLYPVVGARILANLCPVLMPWCDDWRAARYTGGSWKNDVDGQLYYGLADCVATGQ